MIVAHGDIEPQHALSTGELCFYTFVTSEWSTVPQASAFTDGLLCGFPSQPKQPTHTFGAEPTCLAGSIWYPLWKALSKSLYHSILRLRAWIDPVTTLQKRLFRSQLQLKLWPSVGSAASGFAYPPKHQIGIATESFVSFHQDCNKAPMQEIQAMRKRQFCSLNCPDFYLSSQRFATFPLK